MLFAPPTVIETAVWATLPDEWHRVPEDNEWVLGQPGGRPHSVLEGPCFDRDGNFYCVNVPMGHIYRIDATHNFHLVCAYDGWPNGLKIARDGRIFVADYKNGLMLLDPISGRIEPWLVRANLERFKAINDLFIAASDDIYFTDQGLTGLHDPTGRLFRAGADGRVTCLVDNIPSPNGVVMDLDEEAVFVGATRANSVWRVPLLRDGSAAKVANYIQLSGGGGPDGLALDSAGRLLVAHVGLGTVWVFDACGEPVHRIRSCRGRLTTNLAFGGPDGRTLFITEAESGTILTAELDTPGKGMAAQRA
jgi:gluconolactonase